MKDHKSGEEYGGVHLCFSTVGITRGSNILNLDQANNLVWKPSLNGIQRIGRFVPRRNTFVIHHDRDLELEAALGGGDQDNSLCRSFGDLAIVTDSSNLDCTALLVNLNNGSGSLAQVSNCVRASTADTHLETLKAFGASNLNHQWFSFGKRKGCASLDCLASDCESKTVRGQGSLGRRF